MVSIFIVKKEQPYVPPKTKRVKRWAKYTDFMQRYRKNDESDDEALCESKSYTDRLNGKQSLRIRRDNDLLDDDGDDW